MTLSELLRNHEDWLMHRILGYAKDGGYTAYTSTLIEAWRLSIFGLSSVLIDAAQPGEEPLTIAADKDITRHPVAQFGIVEAQKHRERGISLSMFFGLMKYYRQSYLDLLEQKQELLAEPAKTTSFVCRAFDVIETAICLEWAGKESDHFIATLQRRNREMTNEKNRYLTTFESIPNPVMLISASCHIDNMNHAAAKLLDSTSISGGHYYAPENQPNRQGPNPSSTEERYHARFDCSFPWLADELAAFMHDTDGKAAFEKEIELNDNRFIFRVKMAKLLDVSKKFDGLVLILEDVTSLKQAQSEVKTLSGLIPICAHCKRIRDDEGYWAMLEDYIESRSDALFSHSVCDDCITKHYDTLLDEKKRD